jgi:hypothetical protein
MQAGIQKSRQANIGRHIGRQAGRQTDRQTGRQTVRQTDRQADKQTAKRWTYRLTNRQTYKQARGLVGRQADSKSEDPFPFLNVFFTFSDVFNPIHKSCNLPSRVKYKKTFYFVIHTVLI